MGDIRSDDGHIWEVKRVTVSASAAEIQLDGYTKGIWADEELWKTSPNPLRGDSRMIVGLIIDPEYIAFYLNVGNGFILYDYKEIKKGTPVVVYDAQEDVEKLEENVYGKAHRYKPAISTSTSNSVVGKILYGAGLLLATICLTAGAGEPKRAW